MELHHTAPALAALEFKSLVHHQAESQRAVEGFRNVQVRNRNTHMLEFVDH